MVKILKDEPSDSDGLGNGHEDGPHERIAAAIERRILSEEGCGAIGLQGDYGSGKSTIVRLLEKRISKLDSVSMVIFDAWAHEGDPLRRAFLETLINDLAKHFDGLIPEKWSEEKERLAQRHKRSTEIKRSSPSGFGICIAIATGLVPVGLFFSRAQFGNEDFKVGSPSTYEWSTWLGIVLLLAPILITGSRFGLLVAGYSLRKTIGWIPKGKCPKFRRWTFNLRKRAPTRLLRCISPCYFNFLAQQGTSETESDAYESADPTSIEFEHLFLELISDAIEGTGNRIVLVVDNLDRLSAQQSLAVWSNLQTFVSPKSLDGKDWSEQFTLLVPYTPNAIEKLWDEAGAVTSAESFFEKTFQVRYNTPPPTLSNWQGHLRVMLGQAIKEMPHEDVERVLEVFELVRREREERIVPRQLKLHVNSLAVLWDLWQQEEVNIPASHLAYAVLHNADRSRFEEVLLRRIESIPESEDDESGCVEFPSAGAMQVCGSGLVASLAAVYFNVPPGEAIQLLLEGEIGDALQEGNTEALIAQLERNSDAFWIVLRRIVRTKVSELNPKGLATWADSLSFFDRPVLPVEAERICQYVRKQIASHQSAWNPLNSKTISGLIAWVNLDATQEMRDLVTEVGERTARSSKKDLSLQSKLDLVDALRGAELSPRNEQRPGVWQVEMEAGDWLDVAARRGSTEEGVVFIEPICSQKSVLEEICARATSFDDEEKLTLKRSDIEALSTLWDVRGRFDSSSVCKAIKATLEEKGGEQTAEAANAVMTSVDLLHALRLFGEPSVETFLKEDSTALTLLKAWSNAVAAGVPIHPLMASLLYSHPKLNVDKQFPTIDEATRKAVKQLRNTAGLSESRPIWRKLREYEVLGVAGTLAGSDAGSLMGDLIEIATEEGDVNLAAAPWFPMLNAVWLRSQFSERETGISDVVKQFESEPRVLEELTKRANPTDEKSREVADLFLEFGSSDSQRAIAKTFGTKLRSIDRDTWKEDLNGAFSVIRFARRIQEFERGSVVGSSFKTAMKQAAYPFSRDEIELPDDAAEILGELVERMAPSVRKELGKQFFNEVNHNEGGLSNTSITAFGNAILEADLSVLPEELARFTARSLDGASTDSLAWLVSFLAHQDIVLAGVESDARDLLRVELDSVEEATSDEDALDQLEKLRFIFSLAKTTQSEDIEEVDTPESSSETGERTD